MMIDGDEMQDAIAVNCSGLTWVLACLNLNRLNFIFHAHETIT